MIESAHAWNIAMVKSRDSALALGARRSQASYPLLRAVVHWIIYGNEMKAQGSSNSKTLQCSSQDFFTEWGKQEVVFGQVRMCK